VFGATSYVTEQVPPSWGFLVRFGFLCVEICIVLPTLLSFVVDIKYAIIEVPGYLIVGSRDLGDGCFFILRIQEFIPRAIQEFKLRKPSATVLYVGLVLGSFFCTESRNFDFGIHELRSESLVSRVL
jgi:hypothetical protein